MSKVAAALRSLSAPIRFLLLRPFRVALVAAVLLPCVSLAVAFTLRDGKQNSTLQLSQVDAPLTQAVGDDASHASFTHDFGGVRPNTELHHTFTIHNPLDRPRVIAGIKTTCRCTAAAPEASEIPAGGRVGLPVSMRIGAEGGKTVRQGVQVFIKDEPEPLQFQLSASVRDPLTVLPKPFHVALRRDDVAQHTVMLHNFTDQPWDSVEIAAVAPNDGPRCPMEILSLQREAGQRDASGVLETWSATLSFDSHSLPAGRYEHTLKVTATMKGETAAENHTVLILEVRPDVRVVPQRLVFLPHTSQQPSHNKSLALKFASETITPDPTELTYTHSLPCPIEVSFSQTAKQTIDVLVSLPETSGGDRPIQGSISIRLRRIDDRTIEIPVYIVGKASGSE